MGVTITALSRLQLVDPPCARPDGYCEDHIEAFAYDCFARAFEGLADADVVTTTSGGHRFVGGRCYADTDATQHREILTMPYSGYNRFRALVCRAAHQIEPDAFWADPALVAAPFADMINFADSEGCIGPVAAARLLSDFKAPDARPAFLDELEDYDPSRREFLLRGWDGWVAGLALAVDGGMVTFR